MQTASRIIEQQRDRLSPSETRVADFILSEPNPISQMSVGELARRVGVSEPTVIRLCRRLGYKGFRDFKDALLTRITPSNTVLHREISTSDSLQLAASKVLESCARSLLDVSSISQNLPFETAAERLRSASHIVFAGLGASGLVAQDAVHKFFRLGHSLPQCGGHAYHSSIRFDCSARGELCLCVANRRMARTDSSA